MNLINPQQLTQFVADAVVHTYAGSGKEIEPWNPGFKELEYPENGWNNPTVKLYYRDSYSGFYVAPGREVVWVKPTPTWMRAYFGEGVATKYRGNVEFTKEAFGFLKRALTRFDQSQPWQRGPKSYKEGDWEYISEFDGDITNFKGKEKILHEGEIVFSQEYAGGLIIHK